MKDYLSKRGTLLNSIVIALVVFLFAGLPVRQALAQNGSKRFDLVCHDEAMPSVLKKVEEASGFKVLFTYNEVQNFKVTINLKQKTVEEAMVAITTSFPLSFRINGKYVSVSLIKRQATQKITGQVKDVNGEPLPGVNVRTDDPSVGGATDMDGKFTIAVPEGKQVKTVHFTYIGMQKVSVPFAGKPLAVVMKDDAHAVDEVVVTGIF